MGRDTASILAFNRGLVSNLALARTDIDRVRISAETYQNYIPRVFGAMKMRPGTSYLSTLTLPSCFIPFVFSTTDTALVQMLDDEMRVFVGDALVARNSVSSAVANGGFDSNLTSWTDSDEGTAASTWATGGYMALLGTGTDRAIRRQQVTIGAPDQGVEHGLQLHVNRGPVTLKLGTTAGGDDLFNGEMGTGHHSIAVTPPGAALHIELSALAAWTARVDSISIEASGTMAIPSPFQTGDLTLIRYDQSADVVYLACTDCIPYKIERRATRTWSLVRYEPSDGPFRPANLGTTTISSDALSGDVTLTASQDLFKSGHVGSLFRIDSAGQIVDVAASAENTFSDEIRVVGVENTRDFTVVISGTYSGTVTLQRSLVEPGSWVDVQDWTGTTSITYNDALDNQIAYYRIGIKSGDYTSGTADCTLTYSGGSITGIVRIRSFVSATSVTASVLDNLGNTAASSLWSEGAWNAVRGYPSAVNLFEGRLWWAGKQNIWGSVSDAYEGFSDLVEGDAGPISRSIGQGPVDGVNWLLGLERLIIGIASAEKSARSSSFDEPLTPTAFSIKNSSTQGSAAIAAVVVDSSGVYAQRSGLRVYELAYDGNRLGYASADMTRIVPEVCEPGIAQIAVQRQPDTRIHVVLTDGTVAMLIFDELEQVRAWVKIVTDGVIEQAVILPDTDEDAVYYIVNRDAGRFLEKWAQESEADGGTVNKCVDSHVVYSGAATTSITGLDHLDGETVVVWADGDSVDDSNGDPQTFVVASGAITLTTAASDVVVGLAYTGQWKSTKLAYAAKNPLLKQKRVNQLGLILGPTHRKGLTYGADFTTMDTMPDVENEAPVTTDPTSYDNSMIPFNGRWDSDSRVCLQSASPRHATVMALLLDIETGE